MSNPLDIKCHHREWTSRTKIKNGKVVLVVYVCSNCGAVIKEKDLGWHIKS